MSELKVDQITGLGGTLKINNPVGIGAPVLSGYELNTNGKVNVEGSIEVVTIPASNFGVRVRAPATTTTSPGFGDSTLQFTNNAGNVELASIHAKSTGGLDIRTNNASAMTISSNQVMTHVGASVFSNTSTFNGISQFNGQATFDDTVIPKCGGVPTSDNHLVNKKYIETALSAGSIAYMNGGYSVSSYSVTLPKGTYRMMISLNGIVLTNKDHPATEVDASGTWGSIASASTKASFEERATGGGCGCGTYSYHNVVLNAFSSVFSIAQTTTQTFNITGSKWNRFLSHFVYFVRA